jgi:hypothetical protein
VTDQLLEQVLFVNASMQAQRDRRGPEFEDAHRALVARAHASPVTAMEVFAIWHDSNPGAATWRWWTKQKFLQ